MTNHQPHHCWTSGIPHNVNHRLIEYLKRESPQIRTKQNSFSTIHNWKRTLAAATVDLHKIFVTDKEQINREKKNTRAGARTLGHKKEVNGAAGETRAKLEGGHLLIWTAGPLAERKIICPYENLLGSLSGVRHMC